LLSGLLKCGHCGSGYIVAGADKRGAFLRCSRLIETGLCDNRRTIGLAAIEHCVLEGIEKHLGAPDLSQSTCANSIALGASSATRPASADGN
jgi:hypothetical protein